MAWEDASVGKVLENATTDSPHWLFRETLSMQLTKNRNPGQLALRRGCSHGHFFNG
jgi:hypothetical protein